MRDIMGNEIDSDARWNYRVIDTVHGDYVKQGFANEYDAHVFVKHHFDNKDGRFVVRSYRVY